MIISWQIKAVIIAISLLLSGFIGHWLTNNHWSAKWSEHIAQDAVESAKAANDALKKQNELISQLDKVQTDAKNQQARLKADADNLNSTADGLRKQLAMSESASTDATAAITKLRRAAATDSVVRAELLNWSISTNAELARVADDSRARGLACEKAYNSIRSTISRFQ